MVKRVCQKIFKCKATVSKFPAETGHKGTLAAKPVIKKVTRCHLFPCALYCSSIASTRRWLREIPPVNVKVSTTVGTTVILVGLWEQTMLSAYGMHRVIWGEDGKRRSTVVRSVFGYGSNIIWDDTSWFSKSCSARF